ncbi:MAG: 3-phosphoshikimate 1-carboxyvinyltransferase [Kiritimatiellia bacterium]
MDWIIHPLPALRGTLGVPGDKSISHRLALISALARGRSLLHGFLDSEDCLHALDAVAALGAGVRRHGTTVEIEGTAGALRSPAGDLDMGNSGTLTRLLAGLVAGFPVTVRLFGDASLQSRPMRRILDPLRRMGADIVAEGGGERAPLRIRGGTLDGIAYDSPVASAQVKSALLLAGLRARGTTRIREPAPSRDHTERLFHTLGLPVVREGLQTTLQGSGGLAPELPAREWHIPGDPSSAAFWVVAAAAMPGAELTVRNVGLNPTRTAYLDVLREMGAAITVSSLREAEWEPQGDVTVHGSKLRGVEIGGARIANLIDELPILAVAAAAAEGVTHIRDAAELRVKESDRIETVARMLRAAGVEVETFPDGMAIQGGATIRGGGVIESAGDHRIAMAGAMLALRATSPVTVRGTGCVATSYPGFAAALHSLRG